MDLDEYNRFCKELSEELTKLKIDHENIPNELLGINDKTLIIPNEIKEGFERVVKGVQSLEQAKKQFKIFSKSKGVDAAIDYLDIVISDIDGSKKYESKLKNAASKYPDYAILQLKWTKHNALLHENIELIPHYPCKLENYFPGRDSIHPWEFFCYLETYIQVIVAETNFAKLDALKFVIYDLELHDNEIDILNTIITMFQVMFVESYFNE